MENFLHTETVIARTRCWIERVVVALNLCPFARKPFIDEKVRYVVSEAEQTAVLLEDLHKELEFLRKTGAEEVETTVLILPYVLRDFLDYNDFLGLVEILIDEEGYEGEFQVASFHPDYQFGGTQTDDAENYTNRSPYPVLHLIREASVEKAVAAYPHPEAIPERNIHTMEKLGPEKMRAILDECMKIEADKK